jgi:hypothetical protein
MGDGSVLPASVAERARKPPVRSCRTIPIPGQNVAALQKTAQGPFAAVKAPASLI